MFHSLNTNQISGNQVMMTLYHTFDAINFNEFSLPFQSSDDDEVSSPFFPSKSKQTIKLDLSDTFSLQEMTINSDTGDDSDDSQNLELLPPSIRKQYVNKFINYVCCFNAKI